MYGGLLHAEAHQRHMHFLLLYVVVVVVISPCQFITHPGNEQAGGMVLTHRYNRPTYFTRAKSSPDGWNDWATECRGDRQLTTGQW